ncbi:MAG TPA: hypothetical protein VHW23_45600 [Kofleriaceae bacterium]|jgi:hypothetical protein|nr:hypothetical protein [Kofleriaceae bacterium]
MSRALRSTRRPTPAGVWLAIALAAGLPSAGCESAIKHPAITAGIVGGTLGFATCKLGSDNLGACLAVTGGAAAFLGLVAATALWLGGDGGSSVPDEEQVQPLPADDAAPPHRRHHPAAQPPADQPPAAPGPTPAPAPTAPVPPSPALPAPAPGTPAPTPLPAAPPSTPPAPPPSTPPS